MAVDTMMMSDFVNVEKMGNVKILILVWGVSDRGKSQSIKRLAMTMPFTSVIKPWHNDDYDSYVIGTIKDNQGNDRIVGIESQGDPNSNQKDWIEACINANSEIIVAACRSYGNTKDDAYGLAHNNGYEVIEVTTLFHETNPQLMNGVDLRDVFAENTINLIMKCMA